MTTAESIIKNYIEQGYSVEALRLVAEARPQPLRGELLAILEAMEVEAEPVDCVPDGAFQDSAGAPAEVENVVFCVADDVSVDDEAPAYDLMAATLPLTDGEPAGTEESVADVMVQTNEEHDSADESALGVWSRIWQGAEPAEAAVTHETHAAVESAGDETRDTAAADQILEDEDDWIASGVEAVHSRAEAVEETCQPHAGPQEAATGGEGIPAMASDTDAMADERDVEPAITEHAALMPAVRAEQMRLIEAQAALQKVNATGNPAAPLETAGGRKERRRRQRAEKKKGKRNKKGTTTSLPEIVLTSGADDQVMVPEIGENASADEVHRGRANADAEASRHDPQPEDAVVSAVPICAAGAIRDQEPSSVRDDGEAEEFLDSLEDPDGEYAAETVYAGPDDHRAAGDDHVMIIASGGLDVGGMGRFGGIPFRLDGGLGDDEEPENRDDGNIILFGEKFPMFAGFVAHDDDVYDGQDEEESYFPPVLRMLPPVEDASAGAVAEDGGDIGTDGEAAEDFVVAREEPLRETAAALDSDEQALLLRSIIGAASVDDAMDLEGDAERHVIVSWTPESDEADADAREALVRTEIEQEYQARLDEFARRLLEAQAGIAQGESMVREKQAEVEARETLLRDMQSRLEKEEKKSSELISRLDEARRETGARQAELDRLAGMLDEHHRLYGEYEDLRKAYNEVVTDVMPGLQGERDELALTVERQIVHEKKMRSSLASAKRRLAAGYVLSAAACMMLVAMPVANWLRAGRDARELAMEHQRVSELLEQLEREESQNVEARSTIADLEQRVQRYSTELADLQNRNGELARMSQQHAQGIAVFQPEDYGRDGRPTRTSDMALQATSQPGGRLRVNEVRDPAGSIESMYASNQRIDRNAPQMAEGTRRRDIPVSAVSQTRPQNGTRQTNSAAAAASGRQGGSNALRPGGNAAPAGGRTAPAVAATRPASGESVKATVKKGEGVAQVVYRVLGTWDPEVVAWVIRENKIQTNARGNPIIQPGQELHLPKDGRIGQTASAARGR